MKKSIPALDADSVLILRNAGPQGGPGTPLWATMPTDQQLFGLRVDAIRQRNELIREAAGIGALGARLVERAGIDIAGGEAAVGCG